MTTATAHEKPEVRKDPLQEELYESLVRLLRKSFGYSSTTSEELRVHLVQFIRTVAGLRDEGVLESDEAEKLVKVYVSKIIEVDLGSTMPDLIQPPGEFRPEGAHGSIFGARFQLT